MHIRVLLSKYRAYTECVACGGTRLKPDATLWKLDGKSIYDLMLLSLSQVKEFFEKTQIQDEAALRPKAGDKVKIGARQLAWQNITASTNYFDFNAILKTVNDHAAGFMVTYIECDTERHDVIMAVASNDEGRIYFNGVDIYAFSEPRTLMLDADKGKVTLKKGVNVVVFKVINEQNSWQGAIRLLDKAGAPLKDLKIKLSP